MERQVSWIIAIGAVSAGLAVAAGAFGAHALEGHIAPGMLATWEIASRYHFLHSLGMIAVGLLAASRREEQSLRWSAMLMLTGIVLFSGSLYTMALTGERWLGAVTPIGGVAFLAAWGLLAWAALRA